MELLVYISDVHGEAIRKLQTLHQIWEKLKSQYEPKTDATQVHTLHASVTRPTKGGMKFIKSYCNICKRLGHTPQECKVKQRIPRLPSNICQPQVHIVVELEEEKNEEEKENEKEEVYAAWMEENDEYEEEGYNDLMQAFVAKALIMDIPTKKDDKWYLDS